MGVAGSDRWRTGVLVSPSLISIELHFRRAVEFELDYNVYKPRS